MSVTGTKFKIYIFETLPVTRANNMYLSYLFSKIITVRGYAFSIKTRTIFITIHGSAFAYISRIKVSHVFVTNTASEANPV